MKDLIYAWGNENWSALDEFLAACIQHALITPGTILECGSGLSTLVVGSVAKMRGQRHWALEHTPEWGQKVQAYLNRYHLASVVPAPQPLKDYGEYSWYDISAESLPDNISLVICDGPPGITKGGRYGLLPLVRKRLSPGCVILLDDAGREQELATARRWEKEFGMSFRVLGSAKHYIELTVP